MGVVYESLLLFGPLLVVGFLYSVLVDFSDRAAPDLYEIKRSGLQFVIGALLFVYFVWGWSKGRCTLPMQTLGMRVVTTKGDALSIQRAMLRALLAMPSMLLGIGFLWAIVDRDSQTLHDRFAGTRLIYIPVGKMI